MIHAPVADAPQALGDGRVTPGPVADGQVDRQQFAGEGERAGASLQLSGYAAQCAVDQAVAERLRRVDNRRLDYLRLLFGAICPDEEEVEARSTLAFSLVIGHHFLAADHGARSHVDVLELAARWLLA